MKNMYNILTEIEGVPGQCNSAKHPNSKLLIGHFPSKN